MAGQVPEKEYSRYWRVDGKGEVELLHARYRTHRFEPHWHSTLCVAVIQQGALHYTCQRQQGISPAGTLCLIRPGEVHTGWPHPQTELEYRSFYVQPHLLESVQEEGRFRISPLSTSQIIIQHEEAVRRLVFFHHTLQTSSEPLERESALWMALQQMISACGGMLQSTRSVPVSGRIQRVRDYIKSCYAEHISLTTLAQFVNMSPFQCLRMFQKAYGLTPHAYLTQVRVEHSQLLLAQGEAIAQVAASCGFVDQSHFGWHFKRIVGVTPGRYLSQR